MNKEDFDFGFTFEEDYMTQKLVSDQEQIEALQLKVKKLYDSIVPFLDNLCKNPEKTTIHWPNRVEKIQEYKKKLKQIVDE